MGIPPLDAREEQLWRNLMRVLITIPRAMGDDLERSCGLNATEYAVLMHLSEVPERRLSMSDLAKRAAMSASRITRVVDLMSAAAMLERVRDADDGRVCWVRLTSQGLTTLRRAYPHHLASVRRNLFDHLVDEEVASIAQVLDRLARAVDAANPSLPRSPRGGARRREDRGLGR